MGHIHVGYDKPDWDDQLALIKAMDIFLGVPSIIIDPDKLRKQMYGKAGAHRIKKYGVELRTLSNFWLKDQDTINFAFEGVAKAVEFVNAGGVERLTDIQQLEIQTCINTGDEFLAMKLVNEFKLESLINKAEVYLD